MSSREAAQRREITNLRKKSQATEALLAHAASVVETQNQNIAAVQSRNDTWRNLMTASAFARGLGNERPISEVVEECFPQLLTL